MAKNEYTPDFVSHPGATLQDTLDDRGMTQADLAKRTGHPRKVINEIIKGKAPITAETAIDLERALGVRARFWNNRESQYREFLAKQQEAINLKKYADWANQFPINVMQSFNWIPKPKDILHRVEVLLQFFAVTSPGQFDVVWQQKQPAYRKSAAFMADEKALIAWLRRGEIMAQSIACADYDAAKFQLALNEARTLTRERPEVFSKRLVEICSNAGVAVVFVRELPKTRASGATRWIAPKKALIQLSLRYKTNDHLWFTFFHEAGHILRHGKKDVFIECSRRVKMSDAEREADKFSADFLIPPKPIRELLQYGLISEARIRQFANRLGIAPGIVVGRLQHDGRIPRNRFNHLKISYEWQ